MVGIDSGAGPSAIWPGRRSTTTVGIYIDGVYLGRQHGLNAALLDIDRIEMRRRERQPQQLEGFILIGAQRAQRGRGLVAVGRKADLDRLGFDPLVEALGIEFPCPLVEQRRRHGGHAGFVYGILVGAAAERKIEGDQRYRRVLHQPCLDASRAHDALDRGRLGGKRRHQRRRNRHDGREEAQSARLKSTAGACQSGASPWKAVPDQITGHRAALVKPRARRLADRYRRSPHGGAWATRPPAPPSRRWWRRAVPARHGRLIVWA